MICPHCNIGVKYRFDYTKTLDADKEEGFGVEIKYTTCPNCKKIVVYLLEGILGADMGINEDEECTQILIYPNKDGFEHSDDVPDLYLEDYEEAIKVLPSSPKASAALSRRLLQNILREEFNIKKRNLADEIECFIQLENIPSYITDAVDAIRNIGNFAAHPTKNKNTGEIVNVEDGEAEWLIEVNEQLFDFLFVQPKKLEKRRKDLNLKLEEIGKPSMKIK